MYSLYTQIHRFSCTDHGDTKQHVVTDLSCLWIRKKHTQGCKSGMVKKSETLQLIPKLHWCANIYAWRVKSGAGSQ